MIDLLTGAVGLPWLLFSVVRFSSSKEISPLTAYVTFLVGGFVLALITMKMLYPEL